MHLSPFSLIHYFPMNLTYCYDNKIRDKLNPSIFGEVYYNLSNPGAGYLKSSDSGNFRYNDGNSLIHFSNSFDILKVKQSTPQIGYWYRSMYMGGGTFFYAPYKYRLVPTRNLYIH